jgi:hypothetical protein
MAKYPTKEEIMATPYQHSPELIKIVKRWKQQDYKKLSTKDKIIWLKVLLYRISIAFNRTFYVKDSYRYCYNPNTRTIFLDKNNPSILSTLHEYAHHLLGADELEACRYSVWLFKECFPQAFQKLEWKGHMLVKPNADTN